MDISRTGMRFIAKARLPLNARLALVATLPKAASPLRCKATVRWSYPHTQPDRFVVGVELDGLNEDQLRLIEAAREAAAANRPRP